LYLREFHPVLSPDAFLPLESKWCRVEVAPVNQGAKSVVSGMNDFDGVLDGCDAAYEALTSAFGEPASVSNGFRWSVTRSGGRTVMIEMSLPSTSLNRMRNGPSVWIFDPNAKGLSTFTSVDVCSREGLDWLLMEIKRLSPMLDGRAPS
jgi:hypothetical protein